MLCQPLVFLLQAVLILAQDCQRSESSYNGMTPCKNQIMLEDDFNFLNHNTWRHQVRISGEEYEFSVYDDSRDNSWVEDGMLHIKPTVNLDTNFIRNGKLSLTGCTGQVGTQECEKQALFHSIIPPVTTAQLCTDKSFNFKYGTVTVRAMLPKGDWVTPQIWLKPSTDTYGDGYSSGKMKIALARGNKALTTRGGKDIGPTVLESGVLVGSHNNRDVIKGRSAYAKANKPWADAFHNYTVVWKSGKISTYYDGQVNNGVTLFTRSSGKLTSVLGLPEIGGSVMAPFDENFYICLGVTAGSNFEFPGGSVSDGVPKPWENMSTKGLLNFWLAQNKWLHTWSKDTQLIVDYISVTAI